MLTRNTGLLHSRARHLPVGLCEPRSRTTRLKSVGDDFFKGNFAPVLDELHTVVDDVEGTIPASLRGMYMRNGPNPPFKPQKGYHWYEGDGMIHLVHFLEDRVVYHNKFVDTLRLTEERKQQGQVFMRMADLRGFTGLLGVVAATAQAKLGMVDKTQGHPASTSLIFHSGRLLALYENDKPYLMHVGADGHLTTLGQCDFDGQLTHPFTAHPKVDPVTGNLHYFHWSLESRPYLTYGQLAPDGQMIREVALDLPAAVLMHDFFVTQNHAIFLAGPLEFDIKRMLSKEELPFTFRAETPTRVAVVPFTATSAADVTWYELPAFYLAHSVNAWEDGDGRIRIYANCIERSMVDLDWAKIGGQFPADLRPQLHEIVLDPATKAASRRLMSDMVGDLPALHPDLTGRACRYSWIASLDLDCGMPAFDGIVKYDLTVPPGKDASIASLKFGHKCYGGEALFVPRYEERDKCDGEDDGFLLVFVHDEVADKSQLRIYDAHTMSHEPLAALNMPRRVPYGFHATFVRPSELAQQREYGIQASAPALRQQKPSVVAV